MPVVISRPRGAQGEGHHSGCLAEVLLRLRLLWLRLRLLAGHDGYGECMRVLVVWMRVRMRVGVVVGGWVLLQLDVRACTLVGCCI